MNLDVEIVSKNKLNLKSFIEKNNALFALRIKIEILNNDQINFCPTKERSST